jgi:hypothetical protein
MTTEAAYQCMICTFDTALDDTWIVVRGNRCICVRCFTREVGTQRPVPAPLYFDVEVTLLHISAWLPNE